MPKKKPEDRQFKIGDRILVNLHRGRIEEATITAIIEHTSGKKLQVDFGKDMTALIDTWQVVKRAVPRKNSVRLQNQQDTEKLRIIVTSMSSGWENLKGEASQSLRTSLKQRNAFNLRCFA